MFYPKYVLTREIAFAILTVLVSFFFANAAISSPLPMLPSEPLHSGDLYLIKVVGADRPLIVSGEAPYALPQFVSGGSGSLTRYAIVAGAGEPLTVSEVDAANALTSSVVPSAVFDLSTHPAELSTPLEVIKMPVISKIVSSAISPTESKIYILNCMGDAQTGGNGLGRGDADYMDYQADGDGATDIGDGNTDYGVGVDDTDVTKSPHEYKWGRFRKDHNYFLLYTGTGNPIQFLYFDSNYGDNSPTDTLTLRIYAAP